MALLESDLDGRNIDQIGNITTVDTTVLGVTPLINPGQYYRGASNRLFVCAIVFLFSNPSLPQQPQLSFGSGASANDWSPTTFYTSLTSNPWIILWTQPTPVYAASTLLFQVNVVVSGGTGTMAITTYGAAF